MRRSVVLKTALKTIGIVICVLVVCFAVASLGFPGRMATFCEEVGWYSVAVRYSSLKYSYTNDIEDLSRCAEDAILSDNDKLIIRYCEKLLDDDGFESYCEDSDAEYRQIIYGGYACSLASSGEKLSAVRTAAEGCGTDGFVAGNALVSLCRWTIENGDGEMAGYILDAMDGITPAEGDVERYETFYSAMENLARDSGAAETNRFSPYFV